MSGTFFLDAWRQLAQESSATPVRLVRIGAVKSHNVYDASLLEIASDGTLATTSEPPIEVMNIAEPPTAPGQLSSGVDTPAIDVEGQWIVFVSKGGSTSFPAKVVSGTVGGAYLVREQDVDYLGHFVDAPGATDLPASNLAEAATGATLSAVDAGTVVIVHPLPKAPPATSPLYVFDHPIYAKYME